MNVFLPTTPFDLYELHLFHLVAKTGSFTKAGEMAGLTQSAITRQIQGMENRLGTSLLERTTRRVHLTPAGKFLRERSQRILRDVSISIHRLKEQFDLIPKTIRVGVSRSIGLSYLPGFFVAFQKKFPQIQIQVVQKQSREILNDLESADLEVGILCPLPRLPSGLKITHSFDDGFVAIAPPSFAVPDGFKAHTVHDIPKLFSGQRWLMINPESNTRKLLDDWMRKKKVLIEPAMEMDNFDLIVNLVGMGMGVSIVPHRTLALYPKRNEIIRVPLKPTFQRRLVVLVRKSRKLPDPIPQFVENILF